MNIVLKLFFCLQKVIRNLTIKRLRSKSIDAIANELWSAWLNMLLAIAIRCWKIKLCDYAVANNSYFTLLE